MPPTNSLQSSSVRAGGRNQARGGVTDGEKRGAGAVKNARGGRGGATRTQRDAAGGGRAEERVRAGLPPTHMLRRPRRAPLARSPRRVPPRGRPSHDERTAGAAPQPPLQKRERARLLIDLHDHRSLEWCERIFLFLPRLSEAGLARGTVISCHYALHTRLSVLSLLSP